MDRKAYIYLVPGLVIYGLFVIVPFGHSAWLSLFHWNGVSLGTWAGATNYTSIIHDTHLRSAFLHSFYLIIFYACIPILIGLVLTALLARRQIRGMGFFRTVLFLPQVIAMVVVAVAWRIIYAPNGGLNAFLGTVGLAGLIRPWLGSFTFTLTAIGIVGAWVEYGLCMVLFLAGAQKIPDSLYDAASVDGAGPLREFFVVTLPHLRGEIAVAAVLAVTAALRNFDLIYLTTNGGPGRSSTVPSLEVYRRAFNTGQVGSAAAIGVVMSALIFILTILITRGAGGDDARG